MRIELWDHQTHFTTQDGWSMEKIKQHFPIIGMQDTPVVLEYVGQSSNIVGAIDNLDILRDVYRIDPALNNDEALEAYIAIHTAPPPEPEPTAEERIAAALEFMNIEQYGFASVENIERNLKRGLWTADMVNEAVTKGAITEERYAEIVDMPKEKKGL